MDCHPGLKARTCNVSVTGSVLLREWQPVPALKACRFYLPTMSPTITPMLTTCFLVIHNLKNDVMKILTLPTIRILNAMHRVPDGHHHKTQQNVTRCKFHDKKE